MRWNQVEGYWMQLLGRVREQWGVFTHQPLEVVNGQRTQVVGRLQRAYHAADVNPETGLPPYGVKTDAP